MNWISGRVARRFAPREALITGEKSIQKYNKNTNFNSNSITNNARIQLPRSTTDDSARRRRSAHDETPTWISNWCHSHSSSLDTISRGKWPATRTTGSSSIAIHASYDDVGTLITSSRFISPSSANDGRTHARDATSANDAHDDEHDVV
jgi:hypothetical protein